MCSRPAESRTIDVGIVTRPPALVRTNLIGSSGAPPCLREVKHAERGTGLEPERADARNHGADPVEIAILRLAPGCSHAEAARARALGGSRRGEDGVEVHQLFSPDAGVEMGALRTI